MTTNTFKGHLFEELARLDPSESSYLLNHSAAGRDGVLKLQSLDANGDVIGEFSKWLGSQGEAYSDLYPDEREQDAQGDSVPAAVYTLTSERYGPGSTELFWNGTQRFVLLWKDDQIIARTEGDSFLINSSEHESGDYFLTIDYFGLIPDESRPLENHGGSLRRSNLVSVKLE